MKILLLFLLAATLVIVPLLGCDDSDSGTEKTNTSSPLDFVPEKANLIAGVDMESLMQTMENEESIDDYLSDLLGGEMAITDQFDDVMDILSEVDEFILFADFQSLIEDDYLNDDEVYMGIIGSGTFDKSKIITLIEESIDSDTNIDTISYNGYEIHAIKNKDEQSADVDEGFGALAFIGDDIALLSTIDIVKDMIDVVEGDKSPVKGKLLDTYNGLDDAVMRMALLIPPGMINEESLDLGEDLSIDISVVADMETVGLSMDYIDELMSLDVQICFPSSESAEGMEALINSVLVLVGIIDMPDEADPIMSLLDKLQVSQNESCVEIQFEITRSEIEDLADEFGGLIDFGDFEEVLL